MSNLIDLSNLEPITYRYQIGGKTYELREATGGVACQHRNRMISCASIGDDGKVRGFNNIADVEPWVVSLCLFEVTVSETTGQELFTPVDEETVKNWPNKVVKRLYDDLNRVSELVIPEEEAKNSKSEESNG